ncbi:MAG: T9SS type A sorting domain-containing protein, partial [Flavobacteriales bacterium]|nr:T9SS type A sorting domain-containing protein [Flavobacteriales bacterium]
IFDITDPSTMFMTSYWDSIGIFQGTAITKVVGDYAFLGGMEEGLVILDISDPYSIQFVSHYIPDVNFPTAPTAGSTVPNARGMWVENDLVYLAYDRGGFRIIDVSDVFNPVELSQYVNLSMDSVAAKAYNNVEVRSNYAFIPVDYCGLDIVDVSNPNLPVNAGWFNPWACTFTNWLGGEGHTNEIEFVNDSILFMTGGHHDLMVINVADPANPIQVGSFGDHLDSLVAWGMDVQGSRVALGYLDNLTNIPYDSKWGGFKILEWSITTGVEEHDLNAIEVYPNPSNGVVSFKGDINNATFQLYQLTGQLILSGEMNQRLDFSSFDSGIYLLRIHSGKYSRTEKLIIE